LRAVQQIEQVPGGLEDSPETCGLTQKKVSRWCDAQSLSRRLRGFENKINGTRTTIAVVMYERRMIKSDQQ